MGHQRERIGPGPKNWILSTNLFLTHQATAGKTSPLKASVPGQSLHCFPKLALQNASQRVMSPGYLVEIQNLFQQVSVRLRPGISNGFPSS